MRYHLPADATTESLTRYQVAQSLVQACPPELGREILLLGATSRGVADEYDGIELRFYVDALQEADVYADWLTSAEVNLDPIPPQLGIGIHAKGWYRGIFLECSWLPIESLEWTLRPVMSGQQIDHWAIVEVWNVVNAVGMSSAPNVAFFYTLLQHYPPNLQNALFQSVLAAWSEAHWYGHSLIQLWPLAQRGATLALHQRLQREVERALRLVFAANRAYEPDYKWLSSELKHLARLPVHFPQRVEDILMLVDGKRSVNLCLELLQECLTLLPTEIDGSLAKSRLQEARNLLVFMK